MTNFGNGWSNMAFWGLILLFAMRAIDWIDGASRKVERERLRQLKGGS
jgi:hypothetical protein